MCRKFVIGIFCTAFCWFTTSTEVFAQASCREARSILPSIYSVIAGGSDPYSLNQSQNTALCNAGDALFSGAGELASCDNASTPACGKEAHYEFNSLVSSGAQQGWSSNYSFSGDRFYDTTRTEAICASSAVNYSKYFTMYVRSNASTDYYTLNQSRNEVYCDAGDLAISGGGSNVFCDKAGDGGCGLQMLEYNGRVINGNREGWVTNYSMNGDRFYDTVATTVVCLKKTAEFDKHLNVYHVVNEGSNYYSLNQNRTTALCNAGDIALGGGGNPAFCDSASDPACGRVQYLETNRKVTVNGQQGWQTIYDLGGDATPDTQRTEVACLRLTPQCKNFECADSLDNDSDGLIDAADSSCWATPGVPSSYNPNLDDESRGNGQCQDGLDNDGDGPVDAADPQCPQTGNVSESGGTCTQARVMTYSLQPAGSSPVYESLSFAAQLREQGFSSVVQLNRASAPVLNSALLSQYNVVWLMNGCGGATGLPTDAEVDALRDYYRNGGNLILTVDDDAGDSSAPGSCQDRVNKIAAKLGVNFSGRPYHGTPDFSAGLCQPVNSNDPVFNTQKTVFRYSDALTTITGAVAGDWGGPVPTALGTLAVDGQIALAITRPSGGRGTVIFDPAYGSFSNKCGSKLVLNTFGIMGLNASCPVTQCSDNIDNDGDGAKDLADFSCSNGQDNDEANPKSGCQDGFDNDGDGLIDLSDPGCINNQDNNEADGTSQCQDGVDNDGDGVTDFPNDFSCASRTDNDEANPKSQCQDGVDSDSDGLIDLADPGCSNNQDNNEGDKTSQCQDGVDNDSDGAFDHPADFSCSSPQDGDESNPKSQCQDGIDNDSDGAVDLSDFSCSNSQDNDETNPKSQCQDGVDNDNDSQIDLADLGCSNRQDNNEGDNATPCRDGIDNDGDGAIDLADFGCQNNPNDNDESNPKSQCQDGLDNDSDGQIDLADLGCSNNQDNNEGDNLPQCRDGIDNDGDGAIDQADFGCQNNPNDTDEGSPKAQCQNNLDDDADGRVDSADAGCASSQDNDENDGVGLIIPIVEGIFDNQDGTYTAYLGYNSSNPTSLAVPIESLGTGGLNYFSPGSINRGQPVVFNPGRHKGVFRVVFDGSVLSWTVRPAGGQPVSVSFSRATQRINAVVPLVECIDLVKNGGYEATFSYRNENDFPVVIAVGPVNRFISSTLDRGQVTFFHAGNVTAAFKVRFGANETLTWFLDNRSVSATSSTAFCPTSDGCTVTPVVETREQLDQTALTLASTTKTVANMLVELSQNQVRVKIDATRAKRRADDFLKEANELTFKFPDVIQSCPNAAEFCAQVDNKPTIDGLNSLYRRQFSAIRRIAARGRFRQSGVTRGNAQVAKARAAFRNGTSALAKLPRFATECE